MADPVLHQLKISLPPDLVAYVQQQAARTDRTPSGVIRHWIAEQKRREPPPEGVFPAPVLPGVAANPKAIAEAKKRVTALRQERDELRRRHRKYYGTTLEEDQRCDRLSMEIELTDKGIAMAERMLPTNGGANAV
jgi:hypothetical protein